MEKNKYQLFMIKYFIVYILNAHPKILYRRKRLMKKKLAQVDSTWQPARLKLQAPVLCILSQDLFHIHNYSSFL
ncbi:hypothetical protein E2320_018736 [Naja naja]|nr:hypothetical protein E2320_018736 [Naja naja]